MTGRRQENFTRGRRAAPPSAAHLPEGESLGTEQGEAGLGAAGHRRGASEGRPVADKEAEAGLGPEPRAPEEQRAGAPGTAVKDCGPPAPL